MKTILRPPAPVPPPIEEVTVLCTYGGRLVHLYMISDGWARDYSFDPAQAVKLWRCLMGECTTALADDVHDDTMKLWNHVDPKLGDLWEFIDASGERRFCLDADQALALAWAIKECCSAALTEVEHGK